MKPKIALVLGGHGFIGRVIVQELRRRRIEVIVGTRGCNRTLEVGERRVQFHKTTQTDWEDLIRGCDVVVNSVGILRQRWRESYEQVHHLAVRDLAAACAKLNVQLIHISVIGVNNPVRSRFLISKRRGERALKSSGANYHIVRASLIEGERGYGAKWFRRVANWPVHLTPAPARGRVAPIHVKDLARRIVDLVMYRFSVKIHEIGGDRVFTFKEYLLHLAKKPPLFHISVPTFIARAACHIFDLLHITPYSFGHYEVMRYDNVPSSAPAHSQANEEAEQLQGPNVKTNLKLGQRKVTV